MPYRTPVSEIQNSEPAAGDAALCPTVWAKYPAPGAIATRLAVPPAPAPTRSSVCTASGIGSAEPASNVSEFVLAPAQLAPVRAGDRIVSGVEQADSLLGVTAGIQLPSTPAAWRLCRRPAAVADPGRRSWSCAASRPAPARSAAGRRAAPRSRARRWPKCSSSPWDSTTAPIGRGHREASAGLPASGMTGADSGGASGIALNRPAATGRGAGISVPKPSALVTAWSAEVDPAAAAVPQQPGTGGVADQHCLAGVQRRRPGTGAVEGAGDHRDPGGRAAGGVAHRPVGVLAGVLHHPLRRARDADQVAERKLVQLSAFHHGRVDRLDRRSAGPRPGSAPDAADRPPARTARQSTGRPAPGCWPPTRSAGSARTQSSRPAR